MGYKKWKKYLGFVDFALSGSLKQNRSLKLMENLNSALKWAGVPSKL